MINGIFLSLGSNVGRRQRNLCRAIGLLSESIRIERVSRLYETEPVGELQQDPFVNLVLQVSSCDHSAFQLLDLGLNIENRMGRRRRHPMGPRIIDIDLLYFGRQLIENRRLQVPHPAIGKRRFVLVPLNEIAPDFRDPRRRQSIRRLLATCSDSSWVKPLSRLTLEPFSLIRS